jgi:hypothetical protein
MRLVSSLIRTLTSIYEGNRGCVHLGCSILTRKKRGRFNAELVMCSESRFLTEC